LFIRELILLGHLSHSPSLNAPILMHHFSPIVSLPVRTKSSWNKKNKVITKIKQTKKSLPPILLLDRGNPHA
jgi:hypothetical protein